MVRKKIIERCWSPRTAGQFLWPALRSGMVLVLWTTSLVVSNATVTRNPSVDGTLEKIFRCCMAPAEMEDLIPAQAF